MTDSPQVLTFRVYESKGFGPRRQIAGRRILVLGLPSMDCLIPGAVFPVAELWAGAYEVEATWETT